jgi:Rab GTPase-binding effector protein 1
MSTDEMSKLQEQFNAQRARMKEIYLLKEKECVQMKQKLLLMKKELEEEKSQLVIAEYNRQKDIEDQKQEILTLQQLLQETCEEATIANNEISVLKGENERGRQELREMKEVIVQQQQVRFRRESDSE